MGEFVLIGKMKAKPNCEAALEDALETLSASTYAESGCLIYALHRDVEDPSIFVLVEGWASKEALDTHFHSPHFLKYFPVIKSLLAEEPELSSLTPISKGKKGSLIKS